tara:strand:- start:10970 stop:11425 length:456 start_codon:yes stop_codon:yes gene_type:complete
MIGDKETSLQAWFSKLTKPSEIFGGMPPCPFAKSAFVKNKVEIINYEDFPQIVGYMNKKWTKEVVIFVMENESAEWVTNLAEKCNKIYPDFLFLEEHPDLVEEVGGMHLNSGLVLLLVQKRRELEDAREELRRTNYYDKWTEELKQRIFNR